MSKNAPVQDAPKAQPSLTVQIVRIRPDVPLPRYATEEAAGLDLTAALDAPLELAAFARKLVPTGLRMAIPRGYEGQVRPRSGLALKFGVTVLNSPGTIDADYRGEVSVILVNLGQEPVKIAPGDRIAQLVIAPVVRAMPVAVETLDDTSRGEGGFGSTGTA